MTIWQKHASKLIVIQITKFKAFKYNCNKMITNQTFTCKMLKEKLQKQVKNEFFNNNKCFEIFELEIYALNLIVRLEICG